MDLAIFVFENASERRLCSSGYAPQFALVLSDTSVDTRAPYWQSSCCTTRPDMVCGAGASPARLPVRGVVPLQRRELCVELDKVRR